MTDPQPTPEQPASQADIYDLIADQIANGLPAPRGVTLHPTSIQISLDNAADLAAWEPIFGLDPGLRREQPYPTDEPFTDWLTNNSMHWRGRHVNLSADDPITDEHRRRWVDSGGAARRAAFRAREAAQGGADNG